MIHYDLLTGEEEDGEEEQMYELMLTNREVKRMFFSLVRGWFDSTKENYNDFIKAMLDDDIEAMNDYMNDITMDIFSYFDTGSRNMRSASEKFYHGFVIGLMVDLRKNYFVTSNRESGYGRYDIMLEPRNIQDDAIIIEFKVYNSNKEASLENTVAAALQRIEEKQYEAALIAKGIPAENIRKYGFAFEGKKVLIGD